MAGHGPETGHAGPLSARGALAGVVAGAVALSVAELFAGVFEGVSSPLLAVGGAAVDGAPAPLRDGAITVLGTAAKPALLAGMLVVLAAAAAGLGRLASRRLVLGVGGFAGLAAMGLPAALAAPGAGAAATSAALAVSVITGAGLLVALLQRAGAPISRRGLRAPDDQPAFDRRAFVRLALGAGAFAAGSAGTGRLLASRQRVQVQREAVTLPPAARPLVPPPPDLAGRVPGLSRQYTPNEEFYRIDTTLSPPRVNLDGWALRVDGMVERPLALDYEALLNEALVEADATLVCVSNEVGGRLIGNARWLGVPLAELLARAGVHPEATQVVGRSVDGWTAGFPTGVALDGRAALVALGMNGEALPPAHGFPARLVVPGLYGYVSATKWLTELELTTWDGYDAYWVIRGWAKEGPVKTQSRIDVPRHLATVAPGPVTVAGVAWAQPRGIAGVEVRVDEGSWSRAELATADHPDTWRQWLWRWDATPGRHTLQVRATDGDGQRQVALASPPQPDGATGLHTIRVMVEE